MKPIKENELHGGIYNIIRHPGVWGEIPLYIAIGFFVNSLLIIILMNFFIVIYTPIYIHFEDKDLLKRFGDKYKIYIKNTGALIPKF